MKSTFAAIVIACASVGHAAESPRWMALSMLETGNDDHAIGRAGEISRFQILPAIWKEYGGKDATDHTEALRVAILIMNDRVHAFNHWTHKEPTDAEWYLLWNCPEALHPSRARRDRAQRFANLVKFYSK